MQGKSDNAQTQPSIGTQHVSPGGRAGTWCCGLFMLFLLTGTSLARDIHVDPDNGNDAAQEGPLKTIRQAIRNAQPGDTIHLQPKVYHEYAGFYGKRGEPGKPITLDGHGATLEGSDPLDITQWNEVKPDLYRSEQLLPAVSDAILQRWFFVWNGKMVHMGRTSKGPSQELKQPEELKAGEWTFVKAGRGVVDNMHAASILGPCGRRYY